MALAVHSPPISAHNSSGVRFCVIIHENKVFTDEFREWCDVQGLFEILLCDLRPLLGLVMKTRSVFASNTMPPQKIHKWCAERGKSLRRSSVYSDSTQPFSWSHICIRVRIRLQSIAPSPNSYVIERIEGDLGSFSQVWTICSAVDCQAPSLRCVLSIYRLTLSD